ncbi:MAG: nucleotidyltransferase domain-containing protein [Gemmatimonadetes bacterium]|nr:nucleotidyltransferase domain-containing protein [Gemmatimonadota bacterium]
MAKRADTHAPAAGPPASADEVRALLQALLERVPDVRFAYLFGSFAKGRVPRQ